VRALPLPASIIRDRTCGTACYTRMVRWHDSVVIVLPKPRPFRSCAVDIHPAESVAGSHISHPGCCQGRGKARRESQSEPRKHPAHGEHQRGGRAAGHVQAVSEPGVLRDLVHTQVIR
jgi:hypothetical protein